MTGVNRHSNLSANAATFPTIPGYNLVLIIENSQQEGTTVDSSLWIPKVMGFHRVCVSREVAQMGHNYIQTD